MNPQAESDLTNRYLEFKSTSTKIGLEEALVQYRTVRPQDWRFEILIELFFIQHEVCHGTPDRTNKKIRSTIRLLNNEAFIKEHGILLVELIELYVHMESDSKYLIEGFIHLSTRCDMIQLLTMDEYLYRQAIDQLMHCVHRMDTRFTIQISEMIYKGIEKAPQDILWVRFKLVEMQILPDLVTRLTATYSKDTVEFLNGVFTGKSTWFLAQSANSGQYFIKMKQKVLKEIEMNFSKDNSIAVLASIRALAGIIGFFGIKLIDTEVSLCLKILGQTKHKKLVRLLLALVLLAADQFLRKQPLY
ncbi:hypothetical protein BD560DRAFT_112833 [Blakeslea trispora]|nr:hypothetical protein BD560DRAFT_112833 [Blakeslea trispora]